MQNGFTIFAIDDELIFRNILQQAFGEHRQVRTFASAEECLAALDAGMPDLFFLDIEMPGLDGYTLCRMIRERPSYTSAPIIFVSAHDDLDSRMRGFDAGGHDFVVKPFSLVELRQKVDFFEQAQSERDTLQVRVEEGETLTALILGNLDEYAVLIRFLRDLNSSEGYQDMAGNLFTLLRAYRLDGALQLRCAGQVITLNDGSAGTPLEESIFRHVQLMGRIVQFKSRAAFNYNAVSLLINNMPLSDPEACGRLRDHLAIAAETMDARLQAMLDRQGITYARSEIASVLNGVDSTLHEFRSNYAYAREFAERIVESMQQRLNELLSGLAMTDGQEEHLHNIVREGILELAACYDFGSKTEAAFNRLGQRLERTLSPVSGGAKGSPR